MKLEIEDDEKYSGKRNPHLYWRSFNYNSNIANFNEQEAVDFYNVTNNISRVDDFYDEDTKPSQLLNLDNQIKRKASVMDSNYGDEPPYKKTLFHDDEDEEMDIEAWRNKPIEEWDTRDTKNWLILTGIELGYPCQQMSPSLAVPGKELLCLSKQDFIFRDCIFGEKLYEMFQVRRNSKSYLPPFDTLQKSISDDETSLGSGNNYSDGESVNGLDVVKKRSPGRPRTHDPKGKAPKRKLWEFIRDLLLDPKYCPLWICWDDYEKKRFRFVQSDSVAKLWGERKQNKNMTYEKFSRAMRYYYTKLIFVAVPGRRLVYQFGEKATGWETSTPNFDPNYYTTHRVRSNV